MIVRQREIDHRADGDRVVNYHRTLLDRAQSEDCDVRLIDHRQAKQPTKDAGVRNSKRSLGNFLGFELLRARAFGQIVHRAGQAEKVFLFCVFDYRNDQTPIQRDRDADITFLVQHDIRSVHRRIYGRKCAQGFHRSAHEKRHERQLCSAGLFELILHLRAQCGDARDVYFVHGIHMRRNALREHHVFGDALPHHGHRLDFIVPEVHFFARHGILKHRGRGGAAARRRRSRTPRRSRSRS